VKDLGAERAAANTIGYLLPQTAVSGTSSIAYFSGILVAAHMCYPS
jgi:hypothetical protein